MACGEFGPGRMSEPATIHEAIEATLRHDTRIALPSRSVSAAQPLLAGRRVVVTSGPTYEPIDPVRFIGNRSSGKQGHAIARAAAMAGAEVVLVSGPVALPDPQRVTTIHVETAQEMLEAVEAALPADLFVAVAAVADWRPQKVNPDKLKKGEFAPPALALVETPDILGQVAARTAERPRLVVGFAAETRNLLDHARAKLARKGCDMILVNDVGGESSVMGRDTNEVTLLTPTGQETWPCMSKEAVAHKLVARLASLLDGRIHDR